jgi:hypothetical protein
MVFAVLFYVLLSLICGGGGRRRNHECNEQYQSGVPARVVRCDIPVLISYKNYLPQEATH